jgi:hypothetical protein
MKKILCPKCGKELIRLAPFVGNSYNFWCDVCNLDINIVKNDEVIEVKEPHIKYADMTKFLNQNGITTIQPIIASQVDAMFPLHFSFEKEYEEICAAVYDKYMERIFEEDNDIEIIIKCIKEEFYNRGYKD